MTDHCDPEQQRKLKNAESQRAYRGRKKQQEQQLKDENNLLKTCLVETEAVLQETREELRAKAEELEFMKRVSVPVPVQFLSAAVQPSRVPSQSPDSALQLSYNEATECFDQWAYHTQPHHVPITRY
ncbi:hypothetical protein FRC17_010533 [Serendipita sp. 399]|nr:hypothetical protein FRC17_010533 [Serendipita sp. 399]